VVHHRPGKRYSLCRSLLVRWKLHGPGKRRRRRDGIAQSDWKAQPNHRASPSELLPKSHNCMRCITFSTNFRRWVDQNWLEMLWDRALEAGNGGVRLWIFASTHSFTTARDMTSQRVGRWAGRAEEFREGGKDCNFLGRSGSVDEYILASVSSSFSSSSSAAAASLFPKPGCPFLPEKDLCQDRMAGNPVSSSSGDFFSIFVTSTALVSSPLRCTFNTETFRTHRNYTLPLQRRSPPFSSPHPTDPLR
jgi:hypothetical protein